MSTVRTPVYAQGNKNFMTQELLEDKSDYVGDAYIWDKEGLISAAFTFAREETEFPADDISDFVVITGEATGEGTVTLRGIECETYKRVINIGNTVDGVTFGENLGIKRFGLSFDAQRNDGSIDKYVFFCCRYNGMPAVNTNTLSGSVQEPTVTMPIRITPIIYKKADGSYGKAIFKVLNSVKHPAAFNLYKDRFVIPNQTP